LSKQEDEFNNNTEEAIKIFKPSRIILPMVIGVGVILFLIFREFDADSLARIEWGPKTLFGILAAILLTCIRHLSYVWRIRILSDKHLNWYNSFQVMSLWEFSSAITPSMVGGTVAALFLLTKEKIKFAKTTAIIFATIFLDSTFFLGTTISLWIYYGNYLISPQFAPGSNLTIFEVGGWIYPFLIAFSLMITYTSFIAYGLFINPAPMKFILDKVTKLPFLNRWNSNANEFAEELVTASVEIKTKGWQFWVKGFMATALSWSCRFLVVVCLVNAFVGVDDFLLLYGRQLSLFLILFLTPTPGGSGVADFAFKDFYMDFIGDAGLGALIGGLWRLITYYPYLVLGIAVLPAWLARVYKKSKQKSDSKSASTKEATS